MSKREETLQITIKGYQFTLRAPYSPGQRLGEAEAGHLNDLRADNIRDNMTRLVTDAKAGLESGKMLSPEALVELQEKITAYDAKYALQIKHQARPRVGRIEAQARLIAELRLDEQLRKQGLAPDSPGINYEQLIEQFISLPEVQEAARVQVLAKAEAVSGVLESLL